MEQLAGLRFPLHRCLQASAILKLIADVDRRLLVDGPLAFVAPNAWPRSFPVLSTGVGKRRQRHQTSGGNSKTSGVVTKLLVVVTKLLVVVTKLLVVVTKLLVVITKFTWFSGRCWASSPGRRTSLATAVAL